MSALLLDAGALIAVDRADRTLTAMLRVAQSARLPVRTSAPVLAQVWRDGSRQAGLARILAGIDVRDLDRGAAHRTGELLGRTGQADVVDGHLALLAESGDRILTSDPDDIGRLVAGRGVDSAIIPV